MMVQIHHYKQAGKHQIVVEGVLDIFSIDAFDQALEQLEEITSLSIDLSGLQFIDSTGIGGILRAVYLSHEKRFAIELNGMNSEIREMFETVGVMRVMDALRERS